MKVLVPVLVLVTVCTAAITVPGCGTRNLVLSPSQTQTAAPIIWVSPLANQNLLNLIAMTPASPGTLYTNDRVNISIQYAIADTGGGRIWAIPYTGADPTPNSEYQGSDLLPAIRTAIANRYFSVDSGAVKVDSIHLVMCDANRSIIFETIIPVDYNFIP